RERALGVIPSVADDRGSIMETQSGEKKPGRNDCPACGERIWRLVRKGTYFRPTSHCPQCGARISSELLDNIPIFGLALLFTGQMVIEVTYKHQPRWPKVLFLVSAVAITLYAALNLVRIIVKGPYRLISAGNQK